MAIDRQAKLQRLEALRLQEAAARVLLESKSSKEREQGSSILDRILKERASIEGQIASIVDIQTQEIIESYKVQQDICSCGLFPVKITQL